MGKVRVNIGDDTLVEDFVQVQVKVQVKNQVKVKVGANVTPKKLFNTKVNPFKMCSYVS